MTNNSTYIGDLWFGAEVGNQMLCFPLPVRAAVVAPSGIDIVGTRGRSR